MPQPRAVIQVEGAKQLRQQLRAFDKRVRDLKSAHRKAAQVVAGEATALVPVRSGRLKRTIRAGASQTAGTVSAGWGGRVPYAGPIHFGNPRKKGRLGVIRPQPFIYNAADRKQQQVFDTYERALNEAIQRAGL